MISFQMNGIELLLTGTLNKYRDTSYKKIYFTRNKDAFSVRLT